MLSLTQDRLLTILEQAPAARVLVVGDLMLDVYLSGGVSRISPEAPVPVVQVVEERVALGGAANVAANVARLGARCELIGCVGRDAAGAQVRHALSALPGGGVVPHLVEHADRPTTTKTRVLARHQQVVRFDRERDDDLEGGAADALCELLRARIPHADVLALEDYDKGVLAPRVIREAMRAAREAGVPVVVDPKFRHVGEFGGATVFKPNAVEMAAAAGGPVLGHDDDWLERARLRFGCEHLLVTLGEAGMVLRSAGQGSFRVPAVAREVFDVSGAGDTVTACLAVGLAAGASVREAAIMANHAAGIEVGKPGVATVSPQELSEAVAALHLAASTAGA